MRHLFFAGVFVLIIPGCAKPVTKPLVPANSAPAQFAEQGPWKIATPLDDIAKGAWWEVFNDEPLNQLIPRAQAGNLRLQAAMARVEQARAIAGVSAAGELPTLDLGVEAGRARVSRNRPDQPDKVPNNKAFTANRFRVPLYASYELDLWGKLKQQTAAADARVEASLAAYHTVLLTLQADVVQTYFNLRATDEESHIIALNLELRQRARELILIRKRGGLASDLDVERIETELAATEAESWAVSRRRRELEHALAVLVGSAPENFSLGETQYQTHPPAIPVGLPSDLLQRRPDIAEAERLLAARNAEIGIARVAWFPTIKLTGALGYESSDLSELLRADSLIWSIASSLVQPLFEGGRNRANVERAKAAYAENFALYRERLLVGFQEVENALGGLRLLEQQHDAQARAVKSAAKAEQLASVRYKAGLVAVLEVIDAQRTHLQAQRNQLAVRNQQMLTSVALIRALGGGWGARRAAL